MFCLSLHNFFLIALIKWFKDQLRADAMAIHMIIRSRDYDKAKQDGELGKQNPWIVTIAHALA